MSSFSKFNSDRLTLKKFEQQVLEKREFVKPIVTRSPL